MDEQEQSISGLYLIAIIDYLKNRTNQNRGEKIDRVLELGQKLGLFEGSYHSAFVKASSWLFKLERVNELAWKELFELTLELDRQTRSYFQKTYNEFSVTLILLDIRLQLAAN